MSRNSHSPSPFFFLWSWLQIPFLISGTMQAQKSVPSHRKSLCGNPLIFPEIGARERLDLDIEYNALVSDL